MGMRLVRLRIEVGQREGKVGQREGSYSALSFELYCHTHIYAPHIRKDNACLSIFCCDCYLVLV